MQAVNVLGIEIPDSRPLFLAILAVHIPAGLVAVISGAVTALSRKGPGRHPRVGHAYVIALAVLAGTAALLAVMRWRQDWPLFVLDTVAFSAAITGLILRKKAPPRVDLWHGTAMATSYITMLTAFYVDNGPHLPPIDRLPHAAYWFGPLAIGAPITVIALIRNKAFRRSHEVAGV